MGQHDESKDTLKSVRSTACRLSKSNIGNGELFIQGSAMTSDLKGCNLRCFMGGKSMVDQPYYF